MNCGAHLTLKEADQKQRAYCPRCDRIQYEHLKVGAGAIIELEQKILLLQRTQMPFAQSWNLPAGYVEVDESPAHAVIREVQEEVGLQVQTTNVAGIYFFDDDPRGNGILIVYNCIVLGGVITESHEAITPTFFANHDVPENLAGGGHDQAIRAWLSSGKDG